ncbi:unnamed protein product [Adineta steineri]|uniref:Uncharacterized protein n=1 Tax=Adineta steineri TaxID=433720 RepID=A0A814HJJ2_9BILA|nr:unnamed protein product [Adineta steineri]CAF3728019.1 unnamed protein product [Adineta steineri]
MDYYDNYDHDEDDLPVITLPNSSSFTTKHSNYDHDQDNTENDYSTRLVGNWHSLYETSIRSLQSDDEDQRSTTQKPFLLQRQPSIQKPQNFIQERSLSPTYQLPIDSNAAKSKWAIRLPELLSSTVGPDRQKRNITRRHTTNIVFQQSDLNNEGSNPYSLNKPRDDRPLMPIVKQLKQKFDQMTPNNNSEAPSQSPAASRPKLIRGGSLRSWGPNANTGEFLKSRPSRPALPIRPSAEITTNKTRTASAGPSNNRTPLANGRTHRERPSPPVSYPKHFYPPPSTTSVVKQLIGGGATLVYDSLAQQRRSKINSPIVKHQRSIEDRTKDLQNTNSPLTGGYRSTDNSSDTYAKIKNKTQNPYESIRSKDGEIDANIYERIEHQSSNESSERNSFRTPRTQSWNHSNINQQEQEAYYPVYDIND